MLFSFHAFAKSPSFSVNWMQVNCACRVPNASGGFPHGLSFLPAKIWQLWVTLMIIAAEVYLTKMLFFSPFSSLSGKRPQSEGVHCRHQKDPLLTICAVSGNNWGKDFLKLIQIQFFQFKLLWITTLLLWLFFCYIWMKIYFYFCLHYIAFWCLGLEN